MNTMRWRLLLGGALILVGVLALITSVTGVHLGGLIWAAIFILAGLVFLFVLVSDKRQWWASFPAFTLMGIGLQIGIDALFPAASRIVGGVPVLAGIAVSFLVVYFMNTQFWWAIIPAGTMLSICALIVLEPFSNEPVWAFFLGLALTFGVLTLVPLSGGKRMNWPLIPAAVLAIMGILFMVGDVRWAGYFWPAFLIVFGGFFIYRALRSKA